MNNFIRNSITIFFIVIVIKSEAQKINILHTKTGISLRGLTVVDDNTAWVSGSKGSVGLTTDGGKTWRWQQVKGFESADFRDVDAFDDKEAIIIASGSPALILKTVDSGVNWKVCYRNNDSLYFLDAMDFINKKHGWVIGDPVNGKFLLLETKDAGNKWVERQDISPEAITNEAAFAASGTCFRADKSNLYLVTGGVKSRLLVFNSFDIKNFNIPIKRGKASQGAFSLAIHYNKYVIVGGDYANDKNTDSVACSVTKVETVLSRKGPLGYQSCVEYCNGTTYLATGTSGSNLSINDGKSWEQIDNRSFNVCRKARKGKLILLAGNDGRIAEFK
ncbi:oxidoreductase [Mucilaginibacter limnophilus]|uniref:Oxidoreductase n=1 Tax=Mucilaginibacter limnophilus TaxID=1932778 RepID=A0A437MQ71_9SPHI|nr:YCF48-related protein [Mucilaginibacter limnophilus]RVT99771.1 oxidoreductase [Mucilaginibacter limnophilus]